MAVIANQPIIGLGQPEIEPRLIPVEEFAERFGAAALKMRMPLPDGIVDAVHASDVDMFFTRVRSFSPGIVLRDTVLLNPHAVLGSGRWQRIADGNLGRVVAAEEQVVDFGITRASEMSRHPMLWTPLQ